MNNIQDASKETLWVAAELNQVFLRRLHFCRPLWLLRGTTKFNGAKSQPSREPNPNPCIPWIAVLTVLMRRWNNALFLVGVASFWSPLSCSLAFASRRRLQTSPFKITDPRWKCSLLKESMSVQHFLTAYQAMVWQQNTNSIKSMCPWMHQDLASVQCLLDGSSAAQTKSVELKSRYLSAGSA